jgi:hypothetical protein
MSLAGLVLIVLPIAFNVAFGMLAARFDYPDVLYLARVAASRGRARRGRRRWTSSSRPSTATSASRSASTSGTC